MNENDLIVLKAFFEWRYYAMYRDEGYSLAEWFLEAQAAGHFKPVF